MYNLDTIEMLAPYCISAIPLGMLLGAFPYLFSKFFSIFKSLTGVDTPDND